MPTLRANEKLARQQKAYKERLAKQKKIYHGPHAPEQTSREGAMAKAAHLAGLTPEGLAGEILTIYLVHIFQLFFQTQFVIQKMQFELAQKSDPNIAYQANDDGVWPEIHPLDANGRPDYNAAPYPEGEAPADVVIGNGYIPPPDIYRAYQQQWQQYELDMWGSTHKAGAHSLASDLAAMRQPPKPATYTPARPRPGSRRT